MKQSYYPLLLSVPQYDQLCSSQRVDYHPGAIRSRVSSTRQAPASGGSPFGTGKPREKKDHSEDVGLGDQNSTRSSNNLYVRPSRDETNSGEFYKKKDLLFN